MISDRPEEPPAPNYYEVRAAEAIRRRQEVTHTAAMLLAMTGRGAFWRIDCSPMEQWDNEQEYAIAKAVREALADETLTDAERWQYVLACVRIEAEKYASWKAEEA